MNYYQSMQGLPVVEPSDNMQPFTAAQYANGIFGTDATFSATYMARVGANVPTQEQINSAVLSPDAQRALAKSDTTLLRCSESGVSVPAEWGAYRKVLRAIAFGTSTTATALPTPPAFPAGT